MSERERVVLDTNILLSSLMSPSGTSALAVASVLEHATVVQSPETYAELGEKLGSKKIQKYVSPETRQRALDFYAKAAEFVTAPTVHTECRDPKDNKFLDIADAGHATTLVTGDKDLLTLQGQEKQLGFGFTIMSGRAWLDAHPTSAIAPAAPAQHGLGNVSVPSIQKLG